MLRRLLLISTAIIVMGGACIYAAFKLSPWPSVLLIRHTFDEGAKASRNSIASLVPKDIAAQRGLNYASGDHDALLDVFVPANAQAVLPAVVWVCFPLSFGCMAAASSPAHAPIYLAICKSSPPVDS